MSRGTVLIENPVTQNVIERIADRFLWAASVRGAEYLNEKNSYGWDLSPEDLGGTTIGDAIPEVKKNNWPETALPFLAWLKETHLRLYFTSHLDRNALAEYRSRLGYRIPEIAVVIPKKDFEKMTEGPITPETVHAIIKKFRISLIHELQHAYDDAMSNGKFRRGRKSLDAQDARMRASMTKDRDVLQRADTLYLKDPVEVSARFTQAVSSLEPLRQKLSWPEYFAAFSQEFRGWRIMPPSVKQRLIGRLATHWQEGRDTAPKPNYKDAVKRLQNRLREMFGVNDLWLSYSENGRNDHVLHIDRIDTKDAAKIEAILKATSRVADVLGMTVATSEVKHGQMGADLGFVNQRSKRHKDFALPIGTQIYRRPREWKKALTSR